MNENIQDVLLELLETKDLHALRQKLSETNEIDIAEFITELSAEQTLIVFRMLQKDVCSDVFSALDPESQQQLVEAFTDRELRYIVEDLFVDDAVDMLGEMPAGIVKRVLKIAKPETRELINKFLNYPDESAGSVMTAEFIGLKKDMTAEAAIDYIRKTGADKETVYVCYVTDRARVLEGSVSFKDLLYASDDTPLYEIMDSDVISVKTADDREYAANQITKYDLMAIPVVDAEDRLVGIFTADDAFDVIEDEATEDFHKMAAVTPLEKPYLKTSVFELYKTRIPWLIVLMFSSMISGFILKQYSAVIAAIPMLVAFMPMITATGGNAGSQAATLVIRGMATSDIRPRDVFSVCLKELWVGVICGAAVACANFARILLMYGAEKLPMAALTSACLLLIVIIAKMIGGVLPIAAKKLGGDPAIMAAPMITTVVDALSLLIYYGTAAALMM